jgi:hypothetical protein
MELLNKIKSVKLCLIAHPDNEKDSEFEDRISDLEHIEKALSKYDEMLEMLNKVKFYAEVHGMQSDLYNEIEQLIKEATEL